jgi:pilus assembly protein Flp/PilA
MKNIIKKFWNDESGVTAIEYGLIAGLMSALLVVALGMFSDNLQDLFDAISGRLEKATEDINEGG